MNTVPHQFAYPVGQNPASFSSRSAGAASSIERPAIPPLPRCSCSTVRRPVRSCTETSSRCWPISYHVIAPDYLGFGLSDSPTVDEFDYSFDSLTDYVEALLDLLGIDRYAMYVQDYGAPVGWRLILRRPEAVTAVITQNGNAYVEGFVPSFWDALWVYAADPTAETERPIRQGLTLDAIRWQYTHGEPNPTLVSPDAWHHDWEVLQRPGNVEVQLTLLRKYRGNLDLYPEVQRWLRQSGVPVLAVWGRNDEIFRPAGAEAFRTDAPSARDRTARRWPFSARSPR